MWEQRLQKSLSAKKNKNPRKHWKDKACQMQKKTDLPSHLTSQYITHIHLVQ